MSSQIPTPNPQPAESSSKNASCCCCGRRCLWIVGGIFAVFLLLVIFAPSIASREPVRSWVLKKAFPGVRGTITCSSASFGWFSPIVIEGLAIRGPEAADADEVRPVIAIEKIAGNRPLWELLLNKHSPGDFTIEKPVLDVVVTDTGSNLKDVFKPRAEQTQSQRDALKQLTTGIHIDGAELSVSGPRIPRGWKAGPIDVAFEIKDGVLDLHPVTLFDHARLTQRACNDFLQFVAPILADAATVDGVFSLKLDTWKVPLYDPQKTTGSGLLDINSLNVGAGPLAAELSKLLRLSPRILYVKDSPVSFYMKDERIHHVNLTFYIEGILVRTTGSVGLDETLDMTIEIPVPKHLLGDGPLATALAQQTLVLPVGGTLAKPQIDRARLGGAIQSLVRGTMKSLGKEEESKVEGLIKGLIDRKPDEKVDTEALIDDIIGGAGELLDQRRKRREAGEPTLLDQLRKQRQQRLKNEAEKK